MIHLYLITPSFVETNECDVLAIADGVTYSRFKEFCSFNSNWFSVLEIDIDSALELLGIHDGYGIGCYLAAGLDQHDAESRLIEAGLGWIEMNKQLGYSMTPMPVALDLPIMEVMDAYGWNRNGPH